MYAIIVMTYDDAGFYVADDEATTHDLTKAVAYPTEDLAKLDANHIEDTWYAATSVVVKVA